MGDVIFSCGGPLCPVDGLPCDEDAYVSGKDPYIYDDQGNKIGGGCSWGSVACSRCGVTGMDNDLLRLP
jgi:hypothetical protein